MYQKAHLDEDTLQRQYRIASIEIVLTFIIIIPVSKDNIFHLKRERENLRHGKQTEKHFIITHVTYDYFGNGSNIDE